MNSCGKAARRDLRVRRGKEEAGGGLGAGAALRFRLVQALHLGPGALQLLARGPPCRCTTTVSSGHVVQQRPPLAVRGGRGVLRRGAPVAGDAVRGLEVHGKQLQQVHGADGELAEDVEEADALHLVAQHLDARRLRRAEAEHVHDAAAQGELAHLLHGGHALEAHLLQPRGELGELAGRRPARISSRRSRRPSTAGESSCMARAVVTISRARPLSSASSASTRAPPISRCGSPSSYGSDSRWGYRKTPASPSMASRSQVACSASSGPEATTSQMRSGRARCSAASSVMGDAPASPAAIVRSPARGSAAASARNAGTV